MMVNNTDVETPEFDCKPKLDINCKKKPSDWWIGMLFQNQQRCVSVYGVKESESFLVAWGGQGF